MPAVALFAVLFMSVKDLKVKSRDLAPVDSTDSRRLLRRYITVQVADSVVGTALSGCISGHMATNQNAGMQNMQPFFHPTMLKFYTARRNATPPVSAGGPTKLPPCCKIEMCILLGRIAALAVDAAYCYRLSSVVCLSVSLSRP